MTPAIRRALGADVNALVQLKTAVQALHAAERPDIFKPMAPTEIATWLGEQLADATAAQRRRC